MDSYLEHANQYDPWLKIDVKTWFKLMTEIKILTAYFPGIDSTSYNTFLTSI